MKSSVILPIVALLGLGVGACGSARKETFSKGASTVLGKAATERIITDSDDKDNDANSDDDIVVLNYGHAARAADERAITTLVNRYYAAAAADDGAKTCSMLYSILAEAVPEEYGQEPAPPALRGTTCAVVMSKLFRQRHRQFAAEAAALEVTSVRVKGTRGLAVLRFATTPEPRKISVRREHGVWKIKELLDSGMP
jgi:hypothetical protein